MRYPISFALAIISVLLMTLTGCSPADPELMRFASCEEVEQYYEKVALQALDHDRFFDGLWWNLGDCWDCQAQNRGTVPMAGGTDVAIEDNGGASSHSETNLQELGVDEADFMKNDDEFIYVLSGEQLLIVDAWPAEEMNQVAEFTIEGQPTDMYLDEDRLIVFSMVYERPEPVSGISVDLDIEWGLTKITMLDISDRTAPEVRRELYVDGHLTSSRRIDNQLYLVVYHPTRNPGFSDGSEEGASVKDMRRTAISEATVEDWVARKAELVRDTVTDEWSMQSGAVVECTDMYRPGKEHGMGMVSVQALDLDLDDALKGSAILSSISEVYSSVDSLFVTESRWHTGNWWARSGTMDTHIHRFDLSADPGTPTYAGSGMVPGWLLNSFAMSDFEDHMRVATTVGRWGGDTTNNIFVLEQEGSEMDIVGEIDDIAPGESIFAARFLGPKGYIVTFERIDPLFTIDLSEPTNPLIRGELHVSGFSNYLHPLGQDHLIGLGEEVRPQTGEVVGMQVSLFDVADMSDPNLVDRDVIQTGWAWSEAQWDHHAFNYFDDISCLAVPMVVYDSGPDWNWDRQFTGLQLYEITPEGGISDLGRLDQTSLAREGEQIDPWQDAYCSQVRRAVFMEDRVYAVSSGGIVAATVDNPAAPISQVAFDNWGDCYDGWAF